MTEMVAVKCILTLSLYLSMCISINYLHHLHFFLHLCKVEVFLFTLHDIYLCVVHLFASALLNYITRAEIQPGGFMPLYQMC